MENKEQQPKKEYRLGWVAIAVWLAIAAVCDIATFFVPVLGGPVLGTAYFAAFSIYLWKTGHGLVNWKVVVPEGLGVVAEWIPAIQALPAIIVPAIIIVCVSRFEDKTGIKVPLPGKKVGTTAARNQPRPVNINPNIRYPNNVVRLEQGGADEFDRTA